MKKTARTKTKSHSKPTRTTSRTSSKSSKTWTHHYVAQREDFFNNHPNARILLGIFIVMVALYIGVSFWGRARVADAEYTLGQPMYLSQ